MEYVSESVYVSWLLTSDGKLDTMVEKHNSCWIQNIRVQHAIFKTEPCQLPSSGLCIRCSYILSVLLYEAECGIPYKQYLVHLKCFHHCCIRNK